MKFHNLGHILELPKNIPFIKNRIHEIDPCSFIMLPNDLKRIQLIGTLFLDKINIAKRALAQKLQSFKLGDIDIAFLMILLSIESLLHHLIILINFYQ